MSSTRLCSRAFCGFGVLPANAAAQLTVFSSALLNEDPAFRSHGAKSYWTIKYQADRGLLRRGLRSWSFMHSGHTMSIGDITELHEKDKTTNTLRRLPHGTKGLLG